MCPDNYQWDSEYRNKTDLVKKSGFLSILLLKEKFDKLVNFIKSFFQVEWDFQRIEVQQRGSLHLHALFKIKNAPDSQNLINNISDRYYLEKQRKINNLPLYSNLDEVKTHIKIILDTQKYKNFYSKIISESIPDPYYDQDFPDRDKELPYTETDFSAERI